MKHFTFVLFLLLGGISFAQNATIQGVVKDAQSKKGMVGATVMLENTQFGGFTDDNGLFTLSDIPAGTYTLISMLQDYTADTLKNVVLAANETKKWKLT